MLGDWTQQINWEIFTSEEAAKIRRLVDTGRAKEISGVILWGSRANSFAVEKELQKVINIFSPHLEGFESKVQKDLNRALNKDPQLLNDPQTEEAWQVKLRDEFQAHKKKVEEKLAALVAEPKKEEEKPREAAEEKLSEKLEEIAKPKKRGRKPKVVTA